MAEKEVDATGDVIANRPSDLPVPAGTVEELVRSAPDPAADGGKIYAVQYPNDRFIVADHPVVESSGTRLTEEQANTILPAAEASGVRIVEVSE